jgi:hypothetical protein
MVPCAPYTHCLGARFRRAAARSVASAALLASGGAAAMQFSLIQPCAPAQSSAACAPRILGVGAIMDDDAQTLRAAVALWGRLGTPSFSGITLSSNGGSVVGGVQLGREIRRLRLATTAAPKVQAWDAKGGRLRTVVASAPCYSSCVYAFAGGVRREVLDGASLGVHQFSSVRPVGSRPLEADAQLTAVFLRAYLIEMGVSGDLLDLAMATPARDMRVLSRAELVALRLQSLEQPPPDWQVVVTADGKPILRAQREITPGKTAYVSLASATDALVVHVVLRVSPQAIGEVRQAAFPVGRAPRLALSAAGHRLQLAPVMPWATRMDQGDTIFEAVGVLAQGRAQSLLQSQGVRVGDELFASAPLVGVGLWNLDLGAQGLADGLKLLLRGR